MSSSFLAGALFTTSSLGIYLAIILIPLALCIIFGVLCAKIARRKNRDKVGWFFIGFFLGVIGLLIILCIPKENETRQDETPTQKD